MTTLTKDSPARDIAQAMIKDFRENGRAIGQFTTNERKTRCMTTALVVAAGVIQKGDMFNWSATYAEGVDKLAAKLGFTSIESLCTFNNAHSDEEVIAYLEAVA